MRIPELIDLPAEIQTKRLLLREPRPGDGFAVFDSVEASRKELKPWMPWVDGANSVESCELECRRAYARFATREDLRFHIFLKEDGRYIGGTGLHRIDWSVPKFEIGYWIDSRCTGHGYATEAAGGLTQLAFDQLRANRVEIRCDARNLASAAVPKKLGYDMEGVLRRSSVAFDGSGRICDVMVFAKIRS